MMNTRVLCTFLALLGGASGVMADQMDRYRIDPAQTAPIRSSVGVSSDWVAMLRSEPAQPDAPRTTATRLRDIFVWRGFDVSPARTTRRFNRLVVDRFEAAAPKAGQATRLRQEVGQGPAHQGFRSVLSKTGQRGRAVWQGLKDRALRLNF